MTGLLNDMIEALREELRGHGEMLARFDELQEHHWSNAADAVLAGAASMRDQGAVIQAARRRREEVQRKLAGQLRLPQGASLPGIVPFLPPGRQPLVMALADENNRLPLVVEQRARQNLQWLERAHRVMEECLAACRLASALTTAAAGIGSGETSPPAQSARHLKETASTESGR